MRNTKDLVFFFIFLAVSTYCFFTGDRVEAVWFLVLAHMLQGDD